MKIQTLKFTAIASAIFFTASIAFAWTGPTATPPGADVSAPINVSASAQVKQGNLWLEGLDGSGTPYTNGLIIENGKVGIGTISPDSLLSTYGGDITVMNTGQVNGNSLIFKSSGSAWTASAVPTGNTSISAPTNEDVPAPNKNINAVYDCNTPSTPPAGTSNVIYSHDWKSGIISSTTVYIEYQTTCSPAGTSYKINVNNGVLQFTNNSSLVAVGIDQTAKIAINRATDNGAAGFVEKLYNVNGDLYWNGIKLAVIGNLLPTGSNTGETLYWNNASSTWATTSNLFSNGSKVGIGTANPQYGLHVVGNEKIEGGGPSGALASLIIGNHTNDYGVWNKCESQSPIICNGVSKKSSDAWTSSPTAPVCAAGVNVTATLYGYFADTAGVYSYDYRTYVCYSDASPSFTMQNNLGTLNFLNKNNIPELSILQNGNVGIGTTNPTAMLNVFGSSPSFTDVRIDNPGAGQSRFVARAGSETLGTAFGDYGNGNGFIWDQDPNSILHFATNNSEKMTILSNGNVGIGTITPGAKLNVNGNVGISGATTLSSTLNVGGKTTLSALDTTGAVNLYATLNAIGATTLSTLNVTGSAVLNSGFRITSGAGAGKVLTSDASGNASWGLRVSSVVAGSNITVTGDPQNPTISAVLPPPPATVSAGISIYKAAIGCINTYSAIKPSIAPLVTESTCNTVLTTTGFAGGPSYQDCYGNNGNRGYPYVCPNTYVGKLVN